MTDPFVGKLGTLHPAFGWVLFILMAASTLAWVPYILLFFTKGMRENDVKDALKPKDR